MNFQYSYPVILLALATATSAVGQTPTVLESVSYLTVDQYANSGNAVDISATEDVDENAISYESFLAELAEARAAGLGGVIDFEIELPGDNLRAIDKTLINAVVVPRVDDGENREDVRKSLLDNLTVGDTDPIYFGILDALNGSDEAIRYDVGDPAESVAVSGVPGYSFAESPPEGEIRATDLGDGTFALVDPRRVIVVEDRSDRETLDSEERPLWERERPIYSELRAIYGLDNQNAITIRRGARHIREITLADRASPGERELGNDDGDRSVEWASGPINDEFYFGTVSPPDSRVVTLSGSQVLSGGGENMATAKDFLFDPRDRVKTLGFTLLSFANFQYYQGSGGEPDNPDNIIVTAIFKDQESGEQFVTDYRGTTQQRTGGADTFFGIEAPSGAALTRLQVRVVGRNFRTFTHIDDIAFITEPSAPYISNGAEPSLTVPYTVVGRPFYRLLEFQRNPTSVSIPGLGDLGLSFDPDTGLISGTPSVVIPGGETVTITLPVFMTNAFGSREEFVTFVFRNPAPGTAVPAITSLENAMATLGRDLNYIAETILTGVSSDNLDFLLVTRRILEDGNKPLFPLELLGLSLSEDRIIGTPFRADLAGDYELSLYAVTPEGSSEFTFTLKVVPPTIKPDFNADGATDWVVFDPSAGTLAGALSSAFTDADGRAEFPASGPLATVLVDGLDADAQWELVDLDLDGLCDIVTFEPTTSTLGIHYLQYGLTVDSLPPLSFAPEGNWSLAAVDTGRIILKNTQAGTFVFWEVSGRVNLNDVTQPIDYPEAQWPGADLVTWVDFDGDFQKEALLAYGNDVYAFAEFAAEPGEPFRVEAGLIFAATADIDGNGVTDIIWKDETDGFFAVWHMWNADVPENLRQASPSGLDDALAGTNQILMDPAVYDISLSGDFNGDGRLDLAFVDPSTGDRKMMLQPAGPQPDFMEDGMTPRPQVTRDDATGAILLEERALTLGSRGLSPGDPLGLEDDESLNDVWPLFPENGFYQTFEQAVEIGDDGQPVLDENGETIPLWNYETDPFHALPLADLEKPIAGGDVWVDGYLQPGQALGFHGSYSAYEIFERTRLENGRPEASRLVIISPFLPPFVNPGDVKKAQQVTPLLVDPSDPSAGFLTDFAWTPMETALDGSPFVDGVDGVADYDARGNRGFLVERGLYGFPKLDEFGQPVYKLWRNSLGETVEGVAGSLPYELDYIQPEPAVSMITGSTSIEWVGVADYNGDGVTEIITFDQATGFYGVFYPDELQLTLLTRWLRHQFGDENALNAALTGDPDQDGRATLEEYAFGVEDLFSEYPAPMKLSAGPDQRMRLELHWRMGDPTLLLGVEHLDSAGNWTPLTYSVGEMEWLAPDTAALLLETNLLDTGDPVLMRVRIEQE